MTTGKSNQSYAHRHPYLLGIALVFAAALLWSLNGALIKLVYDDGRGPNGVTIAFYRSLVAGLFLLPLAWGKYHALTRDNLPTKVQVRGQTSRPSPRRDRFFPFALRPAASACVVFFALMTICFVVANTMTEAANVIILQYTSTFWIFGLSPWLLREKPHGTDLWLLALAMVGIAIIFAGNASADLPGLIVALASGLFYGLLTLMIRRLRDADSAAVTVLNNLGSALLLLPLVLCVGDVLVTSRALILLIIMGVVQFGLPYYLFALGLVRIRAYQAGLITLAEPMLVPVWTYIAVKEAVPTTTAIGGGIILVALALFVRTARGRGPGMVAGAKP